jgi:hypothetical protein
MTPSLAQAQLYSWKDASGRLIISDTPKDSGATLYAVAYVGNAYGVTTKPQVLSRGAADYDALIAQHAKQHALNPDFVRFQPARPLPQRGDGPDAVDAGHRG